jgi:hypothetical protein
MPAPASNGGFYEVHCSGAIGKALRRVQRRANQDGRGPQALAAIRRILKRLREAPMQFGEPLYRLPVLRMQIRSGVIPPLVIHFAVCEDQPLVFIKGVALLDS